MAKPGAALAADDVEVEMPIAQFNVNWTSRFRFSVPSRPVPDDIEERIVMRGHQRLRSFRLADDPAVLEVRVSPDTATRIGFTADPTSSAGVQIDLSRTALVDLAGRLEDWRAKRERFAAYVGIGSHAKWFGPHPLTWYRSGERHGEQIPVSGDSRNDALKAAPTRLALTVGSDQTLGGPVERELRSALDELVAVVLDGTAAGAILLGRGAAVVGAARDQTELLRLGWYLATAGEGNQVPRGRVSGLVVRPDAVDVIAQAALAAGCP